MVGAILSTPYRAHCFSRGDAELGAILQCQRTWRVLFEQGNSFSCLFFAIMSSVLPRGLVWGHSFVKWLHADLERGLHPRASSDFDLERSPRVSLFGS